LLRSPSAAIEATTASPVRRRAALALATARAYATSPPSTAAVASRSARPTMLVTASVAIGWVAKSSAARNAVVAATPSAPSTSA
jgi:hypothetical protein